MHLFIRQKALPITLVLSAFLAACGGGGSSGVSESGSPSRTNIAESQSLEVARTVDSDISGVFDGTLASVDIFTGAGMTGQSGGTMKSPARSASDGNATLKIMKFVSANRSIVAAAGVQETAACDSGSLTTHLTQKNSDNYSAGDKLTVVANDCLIEGYRFVGGFTLTISATRGDVFSFENPYGMTMAVNYNGFGLVTSDNSSASISGTMTLVFDEDPTKGTYGINAQGGLLQGSASYKGAPAVSVNLANYKIALSGDNTKDIATYSGDVYGRSSALGDYSYNVTTQTPFVTLATDLYPSSGKSIITGLNATVSVSAIDKNTVRIDYTDTNGTKTQTKTWDEFAP